MGQLGHPHWDKQVIVRFITPGLLPAMELALRSWRQAESEGMRWSRPLGGDGISLAGRWEWGDIVSITMKLLRKAQSLVLWCFSASLLLSSCGGAGPECGSLDTDTRNSVVKIVSDDSNNKLVNYAVKNSSSVAAMVAGTKSEAEKLEIWEKARQGAVYRLDDTILMNPSNRTGQEVTCIGLLHVTVADVTAQKEVEFKMKQTADGKIIVSVNPFLF